MTRLDLSRELSSRLHYMNSRSSLKAVDAIFHQMSKALGNGENVTLRRFGAFNIQSKRERMGRNPKTGEPAVVSKRTVCKFKPGITLKEVVDNGGN